jgi:hypothetical protein
VAAAASILAKVFGDDSGDTCYRRNYLRDYRQGIASWFINAAVMKAMGRPE